MEEEKTQPKKEVEAKPKSSKLAVVLIRGQVSLDKKRKDTLRMMNFNTKYNCVILENNSVNQGMIKKVKDFVTYGPVTEETIKLLNEKRPKGKHKFYSLHPPRGGLERKGSKKNFKDGGAIGPRGDNINALIKKMI